MRTLRTTAVRSLFRRSPPLPNAESDICFPEMPWLLCPLCWPTGSLASFDKAKTSSIAPTRGDAKIYQFWHTIALLERIGPPKTN